jgi:CheY-like chemotaxis protein/signal transduction histidine kinase
MSDEAAAKAFGLFLVALRSVLQHLYDPRELRRTPLLTLLGVPDRGNPASSLRQLLIEAVQALKPEADVPSHANTWRVYHILTYRYVEQTDQATVANNMGLSVRQLRRQERLAEEALADYLWARYALQPHAEMLLAAPLPADDEPASAGTAELRDREQELEWVHDSYPSEATDIVGTIEAILKTVGPLARALDVEVIHEKSTGLPPVRGQLVLLRQAFLSLLTAAAHAVPGGKIQVSEEQQPDGIVVYVEARATRSLSAEGSGTEHLDMAQQCIKLFGGRLLVEDAGDQTLATALFLPVNEPVPVLVVDDNLDTLNLIERYLSGTDYRFLGIQDPEQVLTVAQSVHPKVIILDVMLPDIDGWELLGRLREHPVTGRLPIIVCTIMPQEQLALTLGAADYLRKPVSREKLLSTLDRQVRSHRTESG